MTGSLAFSKMHGIGNDFVMLDCRQQPFALDEAQIRALADRHTGVGFDQLISIEPARDASCAYYYGIWNTDGSPAGQCGNGVRAVAAWLYRAGALARDVPVRLESPSGPVNVRVLAADRITVDMGEPQFDPARLPFDADAPALRYALDVLDRRVEIGVVSMGNPHAVVVTDQLPAPDMDRQGPAITRHVRFAEGVNTGFVHRVDRGHAVLYVHERGVGWTRACGTGACAAMAVRRQRDEVDARVDVTLPGGVLTIEWAGPGHSLWMSGPAAFVFEGEWPL